MLQIHNSSYKKICHRYDIFNIQDISMLNSILGNTIIQLLLMILITWKSPSVPVMIRKTLEFKGVLVKRTQVHILKSEWLNQFNVPYLCKQITKRIYPKRHIQLEIHGQAMDMYLPLEKNFHRLHIYGYKWVIQFYDANLHEQSTKCVCSKKHLQLDMN